MKYDYKDDVDDLNGFYEWNNDHYLINKDDDRYKDFKKFKSQNGFYPDECWSLYNAICIFLLPRLKYFKKAKGGYPGCFKNEKEWDKILDKIIQAFEMANLDDVSDDFLKKYNGDYAAAHKAWYQKIHEGLVLFSDYFFSLWW